MFFPRLVSIIVLLLGASLCQAETRLLTGNFLNQLHAGGGRILDLSTNGKLILFSAQASGEANGLPVSGLYLRNLDTGLLESIGLPLITNTGISEAQVSDDGRYICWATIDAHHIYWMDRQANTTRWITQNQGTGSPQLEIISTFPILSANGRYVAFASNSRLLDSDTGRLPGLGHPAVHLYDSQTQGIRIISLTSAGQHITSLGSSQTLAIAKYANFDMTPDARFLVFSTDDNNSHPDRSGKMFAGFTAVLRRDINNGTSVLLNKDLSGTVSNASFSYPRVSADGNRVAFIGSNVGFDHFTRPQSKMIASYPSNLGDDLYLKEVSTAKVWALTRSNNGTRHSGTLGTSHCLNSGGSLIAYSSTAANLISDSDAGGGSGEMNDVFSAAPQSNGTVTLSLVTLSPTVAGNVGVKNGPFMPANSDYIAFGTDQFAAMGFPGTSATFHGIGVGAFPEIVISGAAFDQWAMILPAGQRGPNDNPSGDGVPNLLKYFIGSNALVPDRRFLPREQFVTGEATGFPGDTRRYMTLTIRVRKVLFGGYNWQVQSADTLERLIDNPGPTLPIGQPVPDGDFEYRTFRSFGSVGQSGFMRMQVTYPGS